MPIVNKTTKRYSAVRIIDLFCGAGGLTLGFTKRASRPAKTVWANDFNRYAAETYNANFGPHCVVGDVVDILANPKTEIPQADIVIGGPPCQGFSLLNKNRDSDPRKQLWHPYMEVVRRSGAKIFVMENVPQLLSTDEYKEIINVAKKAGFKTTSAILCAADYGVPQTRRRAFIVGCTFADPKKFFPPKKTHFDPSKSPQPIDDVSEYIANPKPWVTVREAISDLKSPTGVDIRTEKPPYNLHFGRTPAETSLKRYKAIPKTKKSFRFATGRARTNTGLLDQKNEGRYGLVWATLVGSSCVYNPHRVLQTGERPNASPETA